MRGFGTQELVIILFIVIILFGVGRIKNIFGEAGKGIKAFKEGLDGSVEEDKKVDEKTT